MPREIKFCLINCFSLLVKFSLSLNNKFYIILIREIMFLKLKFKIINMKKIIITLSILLTFGFLSFGQVTDPLIDPCITSAGADSKYLKDFRIQLGKTAVENELRYKANMSLWKNTKYRFTMCNTENSKGQLILSLKDEANKVLLSSFDQKSGKTYNSIDFICQKSGIYQLLYDFTNGQQGSALGVVSIVK
jgi:hypothetical protein